MKETFIMANNDSNEPLTGTRASYAQSLIEDAIQGVLSSRDLATKALATEDNGYILEAIEIVSSRTGYLLECAIKAINGARPQIVGDADEWLMSPRSDELRNELGTACAP